MVKSGLTGNKHCLFEVLSQSFINYRNRLQLRTNPHEPDGEGEELKPALILILTRYVKCVIFDM